MKVRTSNSEKFQQLEATIQEKLEQAQSRREHLEQEQKEKLRNHVSLVSFLLLLNHKGILFLIYLLYLEYKTSGD